VLVALWHRWRVQRRTRWLALAALVLALDLLVGARLLAWELDVLRDAW